MQDKYHVTVVDIDNPCHVVAAWTLNAPFFLHSQHGFSDRLVHAAELGILPGRNPSSSSTFGAAQLSACAFARLTNVVHWLRSLAPEPFGEDENGSELMTQFELEKAVRRYKVHSLFGLQT